MNRDYASIGLFTLALFLLIAFTHPVWILALAGTGFYGGWRIGQKVMPAGGD